jgi:hypothetical protein
MKSTLPISSPPSHQENFPLVDYHYQSSLETSRASVTEKAGSRRLRGFWRLSTGFFDGEARIDYATELLLFGVITALSAWPIIVMLTALTRMVRNY